jgi:hypothetical protein
VRAFLSPASSFLAVSALPDHFPIGRKRAAGLPPANPRKTTSACSRGTSPFTLTPLVISSNFVSPLPVRPFRCVLALQLGDIRNKHIRCVFFVHYPIVCK